MSSRLPKLLTTDKVRRRYDKLMEVYLGTYQSQPQDHRSPGADANPYGAIEEARREAHSAYERARASARKGEREGAGMSDWWDRSWKEHESRPIFPEVQGPIIGFRKWIINEPDEDFFGDPIPPREGAEQFILRSTGHRGGHPWGVGMRETEIPRAENEPGTNSCGWHAYLSPELVWQGEQGYGVFGAIAGWGEVAMHPDGFRCQFAQIVCLSWNEKLSLKDYFYLEDWCQKFEIPFVPPWNLVEEGSKYGYPVDERHAEIMSRETIRGLELPPGRLEHIRAILTAPKPAVFREPEFINGTYLSSPPETLLAMNWVLPNLDQRTFTWDQLVEQWQLNQNIIEGREISVPLEGSEIIRVKPPQPRR